MTLMEFTGCALTAYGPALSLFLLTVMNDPVRIIILVLSAFFWLCALVSSSIFWNYIAFRHVLPLCVVIAVAIQEGFRYGLYFILRKAEAGLRKFTIPNTNIDLLSNRHIVPYVSGLGYGIMSSGSSLGNILAELSGPGTMGLKDDNPYFGIISSIFTLMFMLLHTFWSIIFFSAMDSKNFYQVVWVLGSHLFVSALTLFHEIEDGTRRRYIQTVLPTFAVLVISAYLALSICRKKRLTTVNINRE